MARERTGSIISRKTARARVKFKDLAGRTRTSTVTAIDLADAKAKLRTLRHSIISNGGVVLDTIAMGNSLFARIRYRDRFGKVQNIEEKADDRSDAKRRLKRMLQKLESEGSDALQADKASFAQLADLYKSVRLIPAEYAQDRDGELTTKQRGLRSLAGPLRWWKTIKDHFGDLRLANLMYSDLEAFKNKRENTLTSTQRRLSVASVNRELELLRAMLNFAVQNSLLPYSPFKKGPSLISKASEGKRERILNHQEESLFLANCCDTFRRKYKRKGKEVEALYSGRRALMRVAFVIATDTAMRKGEILTLRWSNMDFQARSIQVIASNSKTGRPRRVPMTNRVYSELLDLRQRTTGNMDDLVFEIKNGLGQSFRDNFGRIFRKTCSDAGIVALAFHDLRHTATTRMIQAGISHSQVMKITGHTQMTTFLRYLNPDSAAGASVAAALDSYNANQAEKASRAQVGDFIN